MSKTPNDNTLSNEVLAKLIHDIKAPLRHIVSFSELMGADDEQPLSEEQQEYLGFIQSAADNLGIELERLIPVLKATAEQVELSPGDIAVTSSDAPSLEQLGHLTTAKPDDNYRFAKVLYVEDSNADAAIFKRHCSAIEGYDWDIDHVQSYKAGCRAIESRSYDLYFFDYFLGDGTGLDLVSVLKNQKDHAPMLVITGLDDSEIGEQALIAGATGYAPKQQLSPDVIYQLIRHSHIRRQAELKLEGKACIDGLTGAFNRSHFSQLVDMELARAARFSYVTSLVMLDIDNFKEINDQYGHLKGDHVIIELVRTARTILRSSDILARFGGDEFVVLMPQSNAAEAYAGAERLRKAIEDISKDDEDCPRFSVSLGVATDTTATQTPAQLIEQADGALYLAKQRGRNQVASA